MCRTSQGEFPDEG